MSTINVATHPAQTAAVVPLMPVSGARAGAVMGTILGLMAFASSLMWALYKSVHPWIERHI